MNKHTNSELIVEENIACHATFKTTKLNLEYCLFLVWVAKTFRRKICIICGDILMKNLFNDDDDTDGDS